MNNTMRIGRLSLTNTQKELLDWTQRWPMMPIATIVRYVYPNSKQPEKKTRTFTRHMQRLERLGLVARVGPGWMATRNRP